MRNFITIEDLQQSQTVDELKSLALTLYNDREKALRALRILDGIYVNHLNATEGEEEGSLGKTIEPWLALAENRDPKMLHIIENVILGVGLVVRAAD